MNNRWQEIRQLLVYVAVGIAALIVGIRFVLAPPSMHRQFDGSALVFFGIGTFAGGDKWGLTESRHFFARTAGWILTAVFAGAMIVGGCLEFSGR
jgi:hypothetical protein